MVVAVTSLTGNGLRDWLIQRVSSIIITSYVLFLLGFLLFTPQIDYLTWRELFTPLWVKLFSMLTLFAFVLHGYIGLWTVITDYVRPMSLRLLVILLIRLAFFVLLFWGIQILWSV